MVKIQVKFFLFRRMDIWEAHSNSYDFLQLCGNHMILAFYSVLQKGVEKFKREVRQFRTSIKSYFIICLLAFHLILEQQRIAKRIDELSAVAQIVCLFGQRCVAVL